MNYDLVNEAKCKIYNSELMKYTTTERVEKAFSKIHIYDYITDLLKEYGKSDYDNEKLEGFNRNGESYLGPYATKHTVIHEVLHTLSSKFDSNGHRTVNGIAGDGSLRFSNEINEGITDYIACKISGEKPRNYRQGNRLFSKLEPMMIKYTKDSNILMKIYLNNDVKFMEDFLENFCGKKSFDEIYNNFLFRRDDEIDALLKPIDKNLDKYLKKMERKNKWINLISRFKNTMLKNKAKALPVSNSKEKHKQFTDYYKQDNFSSNITEQETKEHEQYNEFNKSNQKDIWR